MFVHQLHLPSLSLQAYSHIKNLKVKVASQQSVSISFPVLLADIPDAASPPRAGDPLAGFEFLRAQLHPGSFFRLWPGAPLADAVAMTDENVIDLLQAFYPQNHQPKSKNSHTFKGSQQWLDAFPPENGFSFRYFTVTHETLLDKIGWPEGLTDELCVSFTPFLIGLSLDIVASASSATSSVGDVAEVEADKEEKDAKIQKKRLASPSSLPPAKRREHCCRCSSGTCDKCRCAKSRCDSSCQSTACHFNRVPCEDSSVIGANDGDESKMTDD